MAFKENLEVVGQYGLPYNGESYSFPVVEDRQNHDHFQIDTKRIELPPMPEDLAEPNFTERNIVVLNHRYLLRDRKGEIVESPKEFLWRVASNIAAADVFYGRNSAETAKNFYSIMVNGEFLPNSPTLMNAGTELGQLSACFVVPVEDDMGSIDRARSKMTWIHKTGGGTGFNFSKLRSSGSPLSTGGFASGPISFMEGFFDATTQAVKQGGKRRGANMGILEVTHPDIREFITAKRVEGRLTNFNISVAVTDEFMRAVEENGEYDLINSHTGEKKREKAKEIFDLMIENAHAHADPGIVFLDIINSDNPTPKLGRIESTNPCGEQPLLPYESCNLGSINLAKMIEDGKINWDRLERVTKTAVHFLDNVIDVNKLPILEIEEATMKTRKIGLGVMGFADMLVKLGIKYDSEEAIEMAEKVMSFITDKGHEASGALARKRGCFPEYKGSIYEEEGVPMRNATVTTIAPTGSIAEIAGCNSGIEPLFALRIFRKDDVTPEGRWIVSPQLERIIEEFNLSEEVIKQIEERGNLEGTDEIPEKLKGTLRTAHEISPEWHIRMQAAFQKHIDNAVSKTINMPEETTVEEVRRAFLEAWRLGCKGLTIYRDGSKRKQVLYTKEEKEITGKERIIERPEIYSGKTHKVKTPVGTAFISVNRDEQGNVREVFVMVGKGGSEIQAQSEMAGRLLSFIFGIPTAMPPKKIIEGVIGQLEGIGGSESIGFGSEKVLSLPDAIAKVLKKELGSELINTNNKLGEFCPECGHVLVPGEGCLSCLFCAFSKCS